MLLILSVLQWGCQVESYEEREAKRKESQKAYETQRAQLLDDFSQTFNADATWQKSLKDKHLWTVTLQDTLIHPDGRPIAGFAGLLDIERRGSNYIFYLAPSALSFSFFQDLIFVLECSIPDFKPTSSNEIDFMVGTVLNEGYMFAARIRNVRRAVLKLEAHASGKEDADVQVKAGTQFIASGECLGLKYIGDNRLQLPR